MAFTQRNNPIAITDCGRRRPYMGFLRHDSDNQECPDEYVEGSPFKKGRRKKKRRKPDVRRTTKGKGRNFRTTKEGAGMTAKGVAEYRRKNPGSKLKTAVTGKVKKGSKAAKRRKAFCARSKGWTSERGRAARRRWKC